MIDPNFRKVLLDEVVRRADQQMLERAVAAEWRIEQQDKVIANLEEQIKLYKTLVPAKDAPKQHRVKAGRNKSWRKSAMLGLREGLWLAPLAFFEVAGIKLLGTVVAIWMTLGAVLGWAIARPLFLILGLCGYLVERKEK